jgi:hypothetical protein
MSAKDKRCATARRIRRQELERALRDLIGAVEAEVNEKGAGGFLLARLTDARNVLKANS